MNLFERLLRRLDMTPVDQMAQQLNQSLQDNDRAEIFVGGAGEGGVTANSRLFGGLVAAQAAMAAQRTVESFPLHSLHAYFLRPGRADSNIEFHVQRSKEGKNFATRNISAWQNNDLIFQMQASFQRPRDGVHHHSQAPTVTSPEDLPNRDQLKGRHNWQDMPVDVRMASPITGTTPKAAEQDIWLRANGAMPDDPALHLALVVYASDRSLLDTAWRPHADQGELAGASLDHSMWFHQPPRFDEWLLYTLHSPAASGGRGLAFGAMYDRAGQRIVSTAQEGVLRTRHDR